MTGVQTCALPISKGVDGFRRGVGHGLGVFFTKANEYLHNPRMIFTSKPPVSRDCLEDDDVLQKPVGWLVALNFVIFLALVIYAFIRI